MGSPRQHSTTIGSAAPTNAQIRVSSGGCAASRLAAAAPFIAAPQPPNDRGQGIAAYGDGNRQGKDAERNRTGGMMQPEQDPLKPSRDLLSGCCVHNPAIVAKLPTADTISGVIERRVKGREQQRHQRRNEDIRARRNRQDRRNWNMHEWNDDSDAQSERHGSRYRSPVKPPERGIAERPCKRAEQPVSLHRLLGRHMALDPAGDAIRECHVSHGT